MKAARQRDKWEVTPAISFWNLDLIAHLVGQSQKKIPIIIDVQKSDHINWLRATGL